MVGCEKQAPEPSVVAPNHLAGFRVNPEDMHFCPTYDLPMPFPLHDSRGAIGGIVPKTFGLPYHLACQFVESRHADVFATSGHNHLVAIKQRMFADALVIWGKVILVPIIYRPKQFAVSSVEADQFAHVADHIETVVVDDRSGACLLERFCPCTPIGDLPNLCAIQFVTSQLLFLLVLCKACRVDESVTDQCTGK